MNININIKGINDINELLLLRNEIQRNITELNNNDNDNDNIIKQLKKKYMNISNKINYINNRVVILDKYKDKNRAYVKDNYDVIKDKNKEYQKNRRAEFKTLKQFYNDNIKV